MEKYITIYHGEYNEPVQVFARVVKIDAVGYEEFEFAIHKDYEDSTDMEESGYTITETATGAAVYQGAKNKVSAIQHAKQRLESVTVEKFKELLEKAREKVRQSEAIVTHPLYAFCVAYQGRTGFITLQTIAAQEKKLKRLGYKLVKLEL